MKRFLIILFAAILPLAGLVLAQPPQPVVQVKIWTPDSSVRFAAADLATVDPAERPYIRYLSLYNVPKEYRNKVATTVSFAVNSLSRRPKMYIPLFVGGSDETVIRINIDNYDWDAKVFDNLAKKGSGPKPTPDPYFHALIEKLVPGESTTKKTFKDVVKTRKVFIGYYQGTGTPAYREEQYTERVEVETEIPGESTKQKVFAGAPWLDPTSLAYLIKETQSEAPILRADWFIVNALLEPRYHEFLGLGDDIKDFDKLVFADEVLAAKARSQDKAVVISSTVARNNRTLNRSPTFTRGGYRWASHDSLSSIDDRQYVQNLLNEKFDATEDIASLPNGLQAYFLTDGKGKRLDFANPDIAIDNTAADRIVRTARSCIICHGEGIKPIEDEVRRLTKKLQNREQVKLLIADKKDAYRIDDLFGTNLDEQIIKDQNVYSAAVAAATGLKMEENAKRFANIYNDYQEVLLTKEVIARDMGVHVEDVEKLIRLSNDPTVLVLVRYPPGPVRRDQWERSFQGLMLVVLAQRQGLVPIQPLPPFIVTPK